MFEIFGNIPNWFKGEDNRVSVYSSVRISRNFKGINFPSSPGYNSYKLIEKKTDDLLSEYINSGKIRKKSFSSATQEEIIRYRKLRLLPEKRKEIISKFTLYYDTSSEAFLLTNYKDHLTFFANAAGSKISEAYSNCNSFLKIFNDSLFAKDKNGNFQTSGLEYFGSGIKFFSVLALPVLRLSGKMVGINSSFEHNKLSVRNYFNSVDESFLIISNRDSFSGSSAKNLSDFKKILSELKKISDLLIKENEVISDRLKRECLEIINIEVLTFRDFMKIYNILSFLRLKGKTKIKISEVNGMLASIMLESPGLSSTSVLKRSLTESLNERIKKELTERNKK